MSHHLSAQSNAVDARPHLRSIACHSSDTPHDSVDIFGVRIVDMTKAQAIGTMRHWIDSFDGRSRAIFIVNAHTLNLAWEDPAYRRVLNTSDVTFADGTGVRMAARWCGVTLHDNLVGTDLIPQFMMRWPGRHRFFLLGGPKGHAAAAARGLRSLLPTTEVVGAHHGFTPPGEQTALIELINATRPDVLLVGMGNPHQEQWISEALPHLRVPLCVGVGGLFKYWAGQLQRAPQWVRRLGIEWSYILMKQPEKWRRYLVGNPKFVLRALAHARQQRAHHTPPRPPWFEPRAST